MKTEKQIEKMYQEYHIFMELIESLPKFKVKFRNATQDVFARVRYTNKGYVLEIDPYISLTEFMKPTLYHEFTHIYDDVIMEKLGGSKEHSYIYHAYTEYHASQIQMMVKLGVQKAYDLLEKEVDDVICGELLREKMDFVNRISAKDLSKKEDFSGAVDLFCYYIGKVSILIQFFEIYTAELLDLSEFVKVFGNEIIDLGKEMLKCDTRNITVDQIEDIAAKHLKLVNKFQNDLK